MENPLKELVTQLAENAKKAPGWLPLLILSYLGFCMLPEGATILGLSLKSHMELIVPGATLVLYVLGDAFDKPIFRLLRPKGWLDECRRKVETALSLKEGTYRVSKSLATAAEGYQRSWIRVKNESSKLLRSLVIPSTGVGIVLLIQSHVGLGIAALVVGIAFLFLYIWLKASHISDLYALSEDLTLRNEYEAYDLTKNARLFFWKGELVASGKRLNRSGSDSLTQVMPQPSNEGTKQTPGQPSLDHQALWAHFKEQANNIKETMASISTWTFGIASGILAFVITKFLSFESAAITSHHPVLATVVSFGGMALILYLLLMIKHFDARVRGDLKRAQTCEHYVRGLAEVTRSGDQHEANISILARRLKGFAYFYLAAFVAAIVYIWARRS